MGENKKMRVKLTKTYHNRSNSRIYSEGEVLECENLYNGILMINKSKDYILRQAVEVVC
jgi:hypothetical protein